MARRWLTATPNFRGENFYRPLDLANPGFQEDGHIEQIRSADGTLDALVARLVTETPELVAGMSMAELRYTAAFAPWTQPWSQSNSEQLYFPPSRRGGRIARASDWATVTVIDSAMWGQQVWSDDPNCGGVWTESHHCDYGCQGSPCWKAIEPAQKPPCSPLPCPDPWWPFTVHRCVRGNPWQDTAAEMDASGIGRLEAWAAREALRVIYTGMVTGGPIGNPYITSASMAVDGDEDEAVDWDITPTSGAVSVERGIAALSSFLSCCQPDSAGLILVPQSVLDSDIRGSLVYQDSIGRWRTRSGHALVGDCAFDGRQPGCATGGCGQAADEFWLYAVGSIDILMGRPFSPQRLAGHYQQPLFRDGLGTVQAPMSYGRYDENGVFQNELIADYMLNMAVSFSGCCRAAIKVRSCGPCVCGD